MNRNKAKELMKQGERIKLKEWQNSFFYFEDGKYKSDDGEEACFNAYPFDGWEICDESYCR